jgi:type I restriction enzyme, S subunit
MSLPAIWVKATVEELFDTIGGGTPSTAKTEYWSGSIPWISSADISDDHQITLRRLVNQTAVQNSATNVVPAGSVIVVTRVGLGKVAIAPTELCFSQDNQALLFDSKHFNGKYVLFFMSSAVKVFKHIGRGTTISGVTKKQLSELEFILPPRAEQDRIVAEIEKQFIRLDNSVTALKRVQANLKRYRASVLKAACEGRLVPTEAELARKEGRSYEPATELLKRILAERRAKWEANQFQRNKPPKNDEWKKRYKYPAKVDAAHLPHLPKGWSWTSLDAIAKVVGGVTKGQKRKPTDTLRLVPYLRVANVQRGALDLTDIKTIEATPEEIEELMLLPGDILLNEGGDRDKLGRGWIWEGQIPECIHQNHVFRARMVCSHIHPKYVSWYANSFGQRYFFDEGKQTTNLASLNMTKLKGLPIPLPPYKEQTRIVEDLERQLTNLNSLERAAEVSAHRANILRQAVLKSAFAGQLVSQDPSDEPASVLLERIRAERGASKLQRVFNFDAPKKPVVSTTQPCAGSKWCPSSKKVGAP